MLARVLSLLLAAISVCEACDCVEASVQQKRDHADIIFRGTIVELKDSSTNGAIQPGFGRDLKKIVVFKVDRVWKGQVGRTFEMPAIEETSACIGFWPTFLKVGEELLVYASRFGSPDYLTSICGNHKPVKDAEKDFGILGRGREPVASAPK